MRKLVIALMAVVLSACGGRQQVILTNTPSSTAVPSAVGDHEALVFIERDGRDALVALNMDSGETWTLMDNFSRTSGPGFRLMPALSPDGSILAFTPRRTRTVGGTSSVYADGIWVMELSGRGVRKVVTPPEDGEFSDPQWSPDGARITFEKDGFGGGVFVVPVAGGEPAALIPIELQPEQLEWSSDGTRVLYSSRRFLTAADQQAGLYVYDLESGTETMIVSEPDNVSYSDPDWSPDGTRITYVRQGGDPRLQEIYVSNTDGSDAINLTPGQAYAFDPQFSPDGTGVAYNHYDSVTKIYAVRVLTLDGSAEPRTLAELPGNRSGPSW